jgi:hypothetical protein
MNTRRLLCLALFASLASICTNAKADSILIGNASSGNDFPFGTPTYLGEYQQVYSQADFTGPVQINSISFFSDPGYSNQSITGTYTLDFSTTSASTSRGAGGLSTNYASNIGSDNALFFTGPVINTLVFNGTPFFYNPAQGNLLLDVQVLAPDPKQDVLCAGCSNGTNRIYNNNGTGAPTSAVDNCSGTTGYGLETQINFTPVATSVTPEPSSFVLLGTGLLSVVGLARRKFVA